MDDTTLPPEMLPVSTDADAEVTVCRGPPRCDSSTEGPCPFCVRVAPGEDALRALELANLAH
jgi:hypothetical protein